MSNVVNSALYILLHLFTIVAVTLDVSLYITLVLRGAVQLVKKVFFCDFFFFNLVIVSLFGNV
jgi:hypothetical protein